MQFAAGRHRPMRVSGGSRICAEMAGAGDGWPAAWLAGWLAGRLAGCTNKQLTDSANRSGYDSDICLLTASIRRVCLSE